MNITIHRSANASTLSFARIWIFFIWFIWFVTDSSYLVANAEFSIFYKHGIMKIFSDDFYRALGPGVLLSLKCITLYFITAVMFGINQSKWYIIISAILITFYMGYIRGWGGHVNHRELTLLYCTYILIFLPCYDKINEKKNDVYRAAMLSLSLIITLDYAVIGIARLANGFPLVFHPDVMKGWLAYHAVTPSEWNFQYGIQVLDHPWLKYVVASMLPVSTLIEIFAPFVMFSRSGLRIFMVVALFLFHLGIYLLMNIFFLENMLLLLLLLDYTSVFVKVKTKVLLVKDNIENKLSSLIGNE